MKPPKPNLTAGKTPPYSSPLTSLASTIKPSVIESSDEQTPNLSPESSDIKIEQEDEEYSQSTDEICLCRKVVHPNETVNLERMIRCDQVDCDITWFHLACVNLTGHLPGYMSWLCPICRDGASEEEGLETNGMSAKNPANECQVWVVEEEWRLYTVSEVEAVKRT